jgi:hypothetical protein
MHSINVVCSLDGAASSLGRVSTQAIAHASSDMGAGASAKEQSRT